MMLVTAGSVNVTTYFHLRLAADGTDATGLTITGMDLQYVRSGVAPSTKADATALAATDSAHGDNQAIEIDATDQPGLYRVDWPDAAFAAGVDEVILTVKVATAFTESLRVRLISATRGLAGTALPAAAADAAGGLIISDAGGLDADAQRTDVAAILIDTGTTLQAEVDAIQAAVITNAAGVDIAADIIALKAETAAILTDTAEIGAAGAGLTAINLPNQTMDITGNLSGSVGSVTGAVGSVTAGVTLAASAVQAIWDALTSALTTVGSIGKLIVDNVNATISSRLASASYTTPPTVGAIADQVWDEAAADHVTSGTTGAALGAAGSAGDPWETSLPGAYGAGTAGKIIGDNIPQTGDSFARIGAAGAGLTAITAKTDNLPTDPADQSLVIAATDAVMSRLGAPAGASVSADVAAVKAETAAILTDTGTTLQAELDGIQADTEDIQARLPAALTADGNIKADTLRIGGTLQTANDVGADVDAILVDTGTTLQAELDGIQADTEDLQTRVPAALVGGRMDANVGAVNSSTTGVDKLSAHLPAVLKVVVGVGSTTTEVVLNSSTGIDGGVPSATNDFFNGRVLVFTSGALAGQATDVTDYVGATVTMTVTALTGAPASGVTAVLV